MLGLEGYDAAPIEELRGATRRAFATIVDLCCDRAVAFLVIAGDLYDGDWRDFNTGLFFIKQMARLRNAGVKVFVARGNHDAASRMTRRLLLPDNVVVFPSSSPKTVTLEDHRVALHGCSFARPETTENLASHYPAPIPGYFNIGVLHTALNGREGHQPYAPCTRDELIARGYDYWALGHVHQREVLCEHPMIVFPGNTQGRHIREVGEKGCTLVTVADGEVSAIEHHATDVARWVMADIDAVEAETPEAVLAAVRDRVEEEVALADGRMVAMRVRVVGRSPAHEALARREALWAQEVRAAAADVGFETAWIEKVEIATRPMHVDIATDGADDALAELLDVAASLRADPEKALAALAPEWKDLFAKLPPEAQHGNDAVRLDDGDALVRLIEEAVDLAATRLTHPSE